MVDLYKTDPIILFDGVCNLCNGFVKMLIKADKKAVLKFLPLQSPLAEKLIARTSLDPAAAKELNTVVLIFGHKGFVKSTAILEILRQLGFPWRLLSVAGILPERFLNVIYDFVARKRYAWFGKKNTCMVPSADIMQRFISTV
jgi:predicted DCC family thiol-disulfide oxidoreductase YuxK